MLHCRDITKLVSDSMERELPLRRRMEVWMHLMMCRLCAGFARQVRLLRRAAHEHGDRLAPDAATPDGRLPEASRERIKATLRNLGG